MAGEWETTRIGNVVNINPDVIGPDWPSRHIRYIDISSVDEGQLRTSPEEIPLSKAPSRAKRLVQKGDTVLSTVRPNRRSTFFASQPEDDWVVSTGLAVLRPDTSRIVPRYLYACVFNREFTEYLITREKGAAYPAISPDDIANAEIPLPPLKDEIAFYDALEVNDSAVKVLGDETLRTIAQELVRAVRGNLKIDWTVRENVRAEMRVIIKRILRRYGYPPDKQARATELVLEQAEVLCTEWIGVQ